MFNPQQPKVTPTAPIYGGEDTYYEKLYPPAFPRRSSRNNNDAGSYTCVTVLNTRRSSRTGGGGGSRSPADSGRGTMSSRITNQSPTKTSKIVVEIVRTDMPNWLSAQIVGIYRSAAEKQAKIADVVNVVRKDLEKEFRGATWVIVAQRNDSEDVGYYRVTSMPGYGIDLDCNGYAVRISLEKNSQVPRSLRPDQGAFEVKTMMNDMDDKQLAGVKKLAYEALKAFDTSHERSEYLYEKLMKEPGRSTWIVKVGPNDDGASSVTGKLKPGAFAAFSIGPVMFEVAKILSR